MIDTRWSRPEDAEALARLHRDAWRYAYAGLTPGLSLERWIAARGPHWWAALHRAGGKALVIEAHGRLAGYAMGGPCRPRAGRRGEIYELYVDPLHHGAGLGRRLFREARRALEARGHEGLRVWSLSVNELGCRFYRALGGRAEARGFVSFGGAQLERIGFGWP
jgi:ribosomal protein S18 acetylase RimI-like enzyme